jgi:hypothetical protein
MEFFKYREELNIEFFSMCVNQRYILCIKNIPQLQTLYIFTNCWKKFNVSAPTCCGRAEQPTDGDYTQKTKYQGTTDKLRISKLCLKYRYH